MLSSPLTAGDPPAKAAACAACHGADGNSVNPVWPSLAGQHASYVVQQLKAFKSEKRKNANMYPQAVGLSEADMHEIGAYYESLPTKVGAISEEQAAIGAKIYRGGDAQRGIPACMACHGPNGAGNRAAKYPALRGQHPEYTVLQLQAYRDGSRMTDPQAMMRSIAQRMSDEDMAAVAAYVSALY
ncbi:MAG: c-type cytochrome [Pseudomonadota bacterium]